MKHISKSQKWSFWGLLVFKFVGFTHALGEPLTPQAYLEQVRSQNGEVLSWSEHMKAALDQRAEKELLTSQALFVRGYINNDSSLGNFRLIFDRQVTQNYSLGLEKNTGFGLNVNLRYEVKALEFVNLPKAPGQESFLFEKFVNATPVLELTQNFWANGFGRQIQAQKRIFEEQGLAQAYRHRMQIRIKMMQAELVYWRLSAARKIVQLHRAALERAQKLHEWTEKKIKLNLKTVSDGLQTNALVAVKEMALIKAENDVLTARVHFNEQRKQNISHVSEELVDIEDNVKEIKGPSLFSYIPSTKSVHLRDDIQALYHVWKLQEASSDVQLEARRPRLDLSVALTLNGQKSDGVYENLFDSMKASFTFERPSQRVSLNFSLPLDFGSIRKIQQAYKLQAVAAELEYSQKLFAETKTLERLSDDLKEALKGVSLSEALENMQEKKLEEEKKRLQQGRSVVAQVLSFEQDFLESQIANVAQKERLLSLIAQLKIFGDHYESIQPLN